MNQRTRRFSMENLQLFDLDQSNWKARVPSRYQHRRRRQLQIQSLIEHSQGLVNTKRCETDPIYAKTPLFSVIPQSNPNKYIRRVLDTRIPVEIIRPLSLVPPKTPETQEQKDEDDDRHNDAASAASDDESQSSPSSSSSSSSSSSDDNGNDDILNDNDEQNGSVVEQIFNRDKGK